MLEPTVIIHRRCPNCNKQTDIELEAEKLHRWQAGEHVQDVWPEKSAIERETLISGVCSDECWDKLFPPEEGEE